VGGAAVTEEFHPGFRNSVAAYTVSLLHPKIVRDLELPRHGFRVVERRLQNFLPLPDGRALSVGADRTRAEVAKFSPRDAERLDAYTARLSAVAGTLRELALMTPPNLTQGGGLAGLREAFKAVRIARRIGRLGLAGERDLVEMFTLSAGDFLDRWFESDPIKAVYGFDAMVGHFASPYAPGSAYGLLHHAFGEVNGRPGQWGHAIGGMGAITQAMAAAATARGVEIRTACPVREVIVERGRAAGVVTESGAAVRGGAVVSAINPKLLFTRMVDPGALPEDFLARMSAYRVGSGTFRMNVALAELPDFTAAPGREAAEHHTAGIIIAPSLAYMDRAWMDARMNGWARQPIIELVIPSTLDDGLAPRGAHVASLFCQHVRPSLPDGSSWDDHKEEVADLMVDTVDAYAPNFRRSVLARQVLSPLDLERTFGLTGGDIFHGVMDPGQLFSLRPLLGHADYRAPLPGLYMCSAGTHPGGGVTGLPGHNAAREILRDLRRPKRKE
ncbi:MAG: NAD(P)/FAD-dependent oxidoreductase, partial [Alphaproteobacteria bacterium]|nr:NAD(P)/FAD-dependent oxidoreductase [Alphaproteobacteria bacterium]